ncbi:serine/threonine protein kinase [Stigmatella aurantiaca]|uniref:non-specific serine/threonine protein kinase n=1 Tax=Stigmatella aurantiaca (strain DW4/3-1) TaxID=378806 RepID=Q092N0_STIAD|nr:serine/threonine-protein kinase [Stigmatella aurantiaca]ADO70759.1 Protein kinase [Stigmatella aurantiaca DW4/3-1]EAU66724.1 protein kinase [Stigmatella aurantiaca DW4/3-1]
MVNPVSIPPDFEVGPWRVLSLRGWGSYGVVYQVEQAGLTGPFALKLAVHAQDPRFEREQVLLSRLSHPHVPRLRDQGLWKPPGGKAYPYLVMEWVEGVTLYEWAAAHSLTSRQVLRLLAQVARALEATHAVEGVHRDVKGGNILVRSDASVVLMDFGSGHYRGAPPLTHPPPLPGTAQYRSPESLRFQWEWRHDSTAHYSAQAADDVYALGMTAYRLVTGRYPPSASRIEEGPKGPRLLQTELIPPGEWAISCPELEAIIQQMVSLDPSVRGSAGEVARVMERAARKAGRRADAPITPRPSQEQNSQRTRAGAFSLTRWRAAGFAAALGALLVTGVWWTSQRQPSVAAQDAQEGAASGLADEALPPTEDGGIPAPKPEGIALEMPRKPFAGQSRPPCEKPEVEIHGGCWGRLSDVAPPCNNRSYAWKDGCYWPILEPPRPATSAPR